MRVGPYEIISLLGRGGMGEVYRAHDARLHRDVAVKVLAPALGADPDAVARFEREARAVAALNHPNIVSLHDVGREGDVVFAVTELLEGETVRGLLADIARPPLRQVLDIGIQVARGVGAAHAQEIVHRDLKPENLFLTSDRRVKVLDFGLAARRQPVSGLETLVETSPGLVVGTIGYMAPEVVRGEPATAASDTFAFGVVLYELLTGVHPFDRGTPAETLAAIMRDDPPRLSRVAPGTPPPLARLVERCLQKAPGDRPESMRDVAFYLENVDATSAGVVTGTGAGRASAPPTAIAGSRRAVVTAAAAVLGLLASTLGLFWWSERRYGPMADGEATGRTPAYVTHVQQSRIARLQVAASAFAATPNVRSLLETTHGPTAMASLEDYQTGLTDPVVLVLLTPEGELLARTGGSAVAGASESADWQRLMTLPDRAGTLIVAGQPYHAAGATVEAAGSVFGTVIAALPVDDRFARDIRELTTHDVVLLDAQGVRGSTLRREVIPWRTLEAWHAAGGSDRGLTSSVAGQSVRAFEVPLSLSAQVAAVLIAADRPASGPYQALRAGVLVAALAVLAVTAALTWRHASRSRV
jgi:hypothetical protein